MIKFSRLSLEITRIRINSAKRRVFTAAILFLWRSGTVGGLYCCGVVDLMETTKCDILLDVCRTTTLHEAFTSVIILNIYLSLVSFIFFYQFLYCGLRTDQPIVLAADLWQVDSFNAVNDLILLKRPCMRQYCEICRLKIFFPNIFPTAHSLHILEWLA